MESTHIDAIETKVGVVKNIIDEADKKWSPFLRQFVGSCSSFFVIVSFGNVDGFSAILIRQLKNEDSVVKLNSSEESWIASISNAAVIIACIICAVAMEKFGRRTLALMMTPLFFVSWMILCFSASFSTILVGRFLTGFFAGFLSPPLAIYISEISQPSYRGLFLSTICSAGALGILMPHALGIFLKWNFVAGICALLPLFSCLCLTIVPESPSWLLKMGELEAATESFFWFRGQSHDAVEEFEELKSSDHQNDSLRLQDLPTLFRTKSFYTPFLIALLFFGTLQFAGTYVVVHYTITILKNSLRDDINEYAATMFLDVARLITSFFSCITVKTFGRRPLTIFSGMATAATLFSLSLYLHAASKNDEVKQYYGIPLILFGLYITFITIGINPLAWTVKAEIFPLRYRGVGAAMVTLSSYCLIFVTVKSTPALLELLGQPGVFLLFGICCFTGTTLLTIYLPETRNRTLQEIEDSYDRPTWNSEATKD